MKYDNETLNPVWENSKCDITKKKSAEYMKYSQPLLVVSRSELSFPSWKTLFWENAFTTYYFLRNYTSLRSAFQGVSWDFNISQRCVRKAFIVCGFSSLQERKWKEVLQWRSGGQALIVALSSQILIMTSLTSTGSVQTRAAHLIHCSCPLNRNDSCKIHETSSEICLYIL